MNINGFFSQLYKVCTLGQEILSKCYLQLLHYDRVLRPKVQMVPLILYCESSMIGCVFGHKKSSWFILTINSSVGSISPSPQTGSSVYLYVVNDQTVNVQAFVICVGLCIFQQLE